MDADRRGGSVGGGRTADALPARRPTDALPAEWHPGADAAAREGHSELVVKLLESGASPATTNQAGRTALEEAQAELDALERAGEPGTAVRRSRLADTIEKMAIAVLAY